MKNFVNLDKLVRRIWIILWFILFVLLMMKVLFNKWYPIIVDNQFFINICNFIDSATWLKYIVLLSLYIVNGIIILLIYLGRKKYINKLWLLVVILYNVLGFFLKALNNVFGIIFEISVILIAMFINIKHKKFKFFYPFICYMILNLWQINILLIRINLESLNNLPFLISITLQLDYYIFLILTYIGVCHMGLFGYGWFWGKSKTELEAIKAEELKKENSNKELLEQLDKAIKEAKDE